MIENNREILMYILGLSLYFVTFYMIFEPSFIIMILELPFHIGYLLIMLHLSLLVIFSCWLCFDY